MWSEDEINKMTKYCQTQLRLRVCQSSPFHFSHLILVPALGVSLWAESTLAHHHHHHAAKGRRLYVMSEWASLSTVYLSSSVACVESG